MVNIYSSKEFVDSVILAYLPDITYPKDVLNLSRVVGEGRTTKMPLVTSTNVEINR